MKSKSFDLKLSSDDKGQNNKVHDFVGLYKSVSETNNILSEKTEHTEVQKNAFKSKNETPKKESLPNRNRKKNKSGLLDVSHINIDGSNLNPDRHNSSPQNGYQATSTPSTSGKSRPHLNRVKSIMKTSMIGDDTMDSSELDVSVNKPKKRNKSVSFMIDDSEDVVIKKTKSNESLVEKKKDKSGDKVKGKDEKRKKFKNLKKEQQHEKENKVSESNHLMDTHIGDTQAQDKKVRTKGEKPNSIVTDKEATDGQSSALIKKKKLKKDKKLKMEDPTDPIDTEKECGDGDNHVEVKNKKSKKKKRKAKAHTDSGETEGEPATKSRKKDAKPDGIAEDLENLNIGDNAHTITNLLDEMTVVDKEKRKKLKQKFNKNRKPKGVEKDTEKPEGEKEKVKVKWNKRKWNKDRKGGVSEESIATTVIVEGLPISTIIGYKKLLTDHFQKCGLIKTIGIAEVSTEDSKPVFTTTINFYSDGAAKEALEQDNETLADGRIRVKRPLPPTETTLVVRTYAELTEQALSSIFSGAGRIRNIRTLVKGKKAMSTAFIEFDGPESVERAMKMAVDAKIGGKKMHVSKFEIRKKKTERKREVVTEPVRSEQSGEESEDSN